MFFKKRSWNFWNYSIGIIALIILIVFMTIKEINGTNDLEANRKYAVGKVIDFHYRKGNYAIVSFKDDEKEYKSHFHISWESFIGEKYMIKYNSKNPDNNVTILEKPVFTKDQKTDTTTGTITKFVSFPRGVEFGYKVDTIKYYKTVHINESISEKIKINQIYKVEYLVDTPRIAIIKLEGN